ncbi:PPIC-type PPIASE domain protein [compost metagenome]
MPLDALREIAAQTLALVRGDPSTFAEHARALSNCPSGVNDGHLGRVFRGETAPEF